MRRDEPGLFSVLLRHWRTKRGLSQLDLSLAAEVSSRHISFLETGRAQPSREMVLVLGGALDLPLRDQNGLLRAAGFEAHFEEPAERGALPCEIERVLGYMLAKHEPFPMIVMERGYDVVKVNQAGTALFGRLTREPYSAGETVNLMRALFDPRRTRPFVVDWECLARAMLLKLHREALARPSDGAIQGLVRELLGYPGVPASFHQLDFTRPSEPTVRVRLRRDALDLAFITTLTVFDSPQSVTTEELRIESYFPIDAATERACRDL